MLAEKDVPSAAVGTDCTWFLDCAARPEDRKQYRTGRWECV